MSDQSPWGAPPPSGPSGPSSQPPYQSGGAGGWSGGPPSYGVPLHQGPQGPQGPRKRTGLIIGIVAAVLLVAGAFALTLVLVGGGDDAPDEASSSQATSEATTDPTESDPTEPTEPTDPTTSGSPTDEPSTDEPQPGDGDIVGDGYSYDLPAAGWKDASVDAKDLAGTIDTAIVLGASINMAQSSIIVEALSAGGVESLEDLESLWKRNLSSSDNATPVDIEDITIDGERAIGVRIDDRVNNEGTPISQIAYLTLRDGMQYSIGLSLPQTGDDVSEGDFRTMLDSWSWSS